jgi:RNA polymerase sigma-70 factor (ECF subfamily)
MIKDFTQLYRDYAGDVFRFALYLCGSADWAEDLTSETFVRVWTRRDSLWMPTVKAYLLAIVRNLYLKQLRSEQRFTRLDDHLPSRASGPEASVEQRSELWAVLRGLQTLTEVDRAALLMRALYDMPYQEIAAALGVSLAAARVKVHRARLKLVDFRDQEMDGGRHDRSDS